MLLVIIVGVKLCDFHKNPVYMGRRPCRSTAERAEARGVLLVNSGHFLPTGSDEVVLEVLEQAGVTTVPPLNSQDLKDPLLLLLFVRDSNEHPQGR